MIIKVIRSYSCHEASVAIIVIMNKWSYQYRPSTDGMIIFDSQYTPENVGHSKKVLGGPFLEYYCT